MRYGVYAGYRDSGVEWLGEVPEHWEILKLKRIAKLKSGESITSNEIKDTGCYPVYGGNGFRGYFTNYTHDGRYALIGRQGALCGNINYAEGKFWASEHAIVVSNQKVNTFWLGELLRAMNLNQYSMSAAQPGLSVESITNLYIPLPSASEQTAIANFLDRETSKIDQLINKQQHMITLLQEKRQAVISHAVTKGLDSDARMKDSGVEWLGEVPEHWAVCLLKYFTMKITDGAHISPETKGGIYKYISTRNLVGDIIDFENCLLTSPNNYEYLVKAGCKPEVNDVLFSKDGTIGKTIVVKEEYEFVVASSLIIITPNQDLLFSGFLNYLCQSNSISQQVKSFVLGAGLPRLSIQNLKKISGVFPPITEQIFITNYLNQQTEKIDKLIEKATQAIALLKERRTALISAAVTGKIDVRPH